MNKTVCIVVFLFILGGIGLAQQITVTQPAAGETWKTGGTYVIKWTHSGVTKPTVKVMLWQGSNFVMDIENVQPIIASRVWTIPATVAPGTYKIRVKVIGESTLGISDAFNIVAPDPPKQVSRPLRDRPVFHIKFPALSISDVKLSPNSEGFVFTFGYKNSGEGPLPKGSEMPEKPSFRVLIDNREVNKGSLFIPEFPAEPGWKVQTYHGCDIKYQTGREFDRTWTIGNTITVKINENAVNGMASDSQTYNLKPMALNYSYDAILTGATLDWAQEILTVNVRIDGQIGSLNKFILFNSAANEYVVDGLGSFLKTISLVPGQRLYSFTQKIGGIARWRKEYTAYMGIFLIRDSDALSDVRDIEHRNNINIITFKQ